MSSSTFQQVDDLRQRGNHEFQQGNLHAAISLYTAGLEVLVESSSSSSTDNKNNNDQTQIVLLCNRSACYYQLNEYESALQDALKAYVELSKCTNIKAAYRLAKTYVALEDWNPALTIINDVLKPTGTLGLSSNGSLTQDQMKSFESLKKQIVEIQNQSVTKQKETSIKNVTRPLSIREFEKPSREDDTSSLGIGNFSEIVICTHKRTKETFALKMLEKKKAEELGKRQHPNVYNEIAMESRVLLQRLPSHRNIIRMYHSFQDYTCIYYLMELHNVNKDLWTCLRYKKAMVGTYPSQCRLWFDQLVTAIEHCHRHGIVHRDIKPENVLLDSNNHVILIDFGTAKDMIRQDLNGPEFVGTPDFMSPEAVTGISSMKKPTQADMASNKVASPASDLWALGATLYIMLSGTTPFWSPSPYLTFLRIQRGLIHKLGVFENNLDAWDMITSLMKVKATERLGANVFTWSQSPDESEIQLMKTKSYDCLRAHPYLASLNDKDDSRTQNKLKQHVIPSLQDLSLRQCSEMVQRQALDLDLCDNHPPGDSSKYDMLRLSEKQRYSILHILEKMKTFKGSRDETRVLLRFYKTQLDVMKAKVSYPQNQRHEFLGLTRMIDDEYKLPSHRGSEDPYATKDQLLNPTTQIVVLSNPLLVLTPEEVEKLEDGMEKTYISQWKQCIATINKQRPKAVVVCSGGQTPIHKKCWKLLGRIRDTIPIIWNDGTTYYTFWLNGFQGIVLRSTNELTIDVERIDETSSDQMKWISEQMEQSRMAKHQVYAFVDCDPRHLHPLVVKRLARGRVLALFGLVASSPSEDIATEKLASNDSIYKVDDSGSLDFEVTYEPNEKVASSKNNRRRQRHRGRRQEEEKDEKAVEQENNDDDDDVSVKSNDSVEDDMDRATMRVLGTSTNSVRWLTIDEKEEWTTSLEILS